MKLERFLPLFLLLILLSVILFSFFISPPLPSSQSSITINLSFEAECASGEREACITENNCSGIRFCSNDKWSPCVINKVCTPGTTIGCYINECESGFKICNPCGTGYGECLQPSNTSEKNR